MRSNILLAPAIFSMLFQPVTSSAEMIPADGDAWTEYVTAQEAFDDGWNADCGLNLQLIVSDIEHCVGECSVGYRNIQTRWATPFHYEKPGWDQGAQPLDGLTRLTFWYRATWSAPNPPWFVRIYMAPTAEEIDAGVTEKRVVWSFDMGPEAQWTEVNGFLNEGTWEWQVNSMWLPTGGNTILTDLLRIEWFYMVPYGFPLGEEFLLDGLCLELSGAGATPEPDLGWADLLTIAPNPLRSETTVRFTLPRPGPATIDLFDIRGRHIRRLFREPRAEGLQIVAWDGRDELGRTVADGVYLCRLSGETGSGTRKVNVSR